MATPQRNGRHRWTIISAGAVTVATIVGGVVTTLDYIHGIENGQIQQTRDWAARSAVMEYRVGRDEAEIDRLRDQLRCR